MMICVRFHALQDDFRLHSREKKNLIHVSLFFHHICITCLFFVSCPLKLNTTQFGVNVPTRGKKIFDARDKDEKNIFSFLINCFAVSTILWPRKIVFRFFPALARTYAVPWGWLKKNEESSSKQGWEKRVVASVWKRKKKKL